MMKEKNTFTYNLTTSQISQRNRLKIKQSKLFHYSHFPPEEE
jgi:hypothetical protein